jgi:hypothetical protein
MAKPSTVRFNLQVDLQPEEVPTLIGLVDGDQNEVQKLSTLSESLLHDTSGGGMMLTPDEMARITEATGLDPNCGEDLIPLLSEASGKEEGKLTFKISVDPVYEAYYREAAEMQGRSVKELVQDIINTIMDNDPLQYNMGNFGFPEVFRMLPKDKEGVEQLLGGKFQDGMSLVSLIRKALGSDMFEGMVDSPSQTGEK